MTLLLLALGCTGAGTVDTAVSTDPCADGPRVTYTNWGRGFFLNYCTSCHSAAAPNRYGAPDTVDFDTEEQVVTFAAAIRRAVLEEETMPVGGGVYDDDLVLLDQLLTCGL